MVFLLHDINDIFLEVRWRVVAFNPLPCVSSDQCVESHRSNTTVFDVPANSACDSLLHHAAGTARRLMFCMLHGMQTAKMVRYAGVTALLPDTIFVMFMLTWIASRCIYFPFFIIRSTLFESAVSRQPPPRFPARVVLLSQQNLPVTNKQRASLPTHWYLRASNSEPHTAPLLFQELADG
jgi:hypothetical protein